MRGDAKRLANARGKLVRLTHLSPTQLNPSEDAAGLALSITELENCDRLRLGPGPAVTWFSRSVGSCPEKQGVVSRNAYRGRSFAQNRKPSSKCSCLHSRGRLWVRTALSSVGSGIWSVAMAPSADFRLESLLRLCRGLFSKLLQCFDLRTAPGRPRRVQLHLHRCQPGLPLLSPQRTAEGAASRRKCGELPFIPGPRDP